MTSSRISAALGATAVVTGLTIQEYFARHWGGGPQRFQSMLLAQMIGASLWLVFTPVVIIPLVRRFPLDGERRGTHLAIHLAIALALAVVQTLATAVPFAMYYYGWSPLAIRDVFRDRMHTAFAWSAFIYLLIAGVVQLRRFGATSSEALAKVDDQTALGLPAAQANERFLRRILVRADGRIGVVPVERVDWIEAADNNVVVHAGSAKHVVRATLSRLADRLDPETFVRVHRSAVVNVERVREVQPWYHGELVLFLDDATRLTIGRSYRDKFLSALDG